MVLWLCPLLAFLVGSIPFGLLIARARGIDIRAQGSGNIGATNVFRIVGKKSGVTCMLLDFLKGLVPTLLAISLIRFAGGDRTFVIPAVAAWGIELPADRQWLAQLLQVLTGLAGASEPPETVGASVPASAGPREALLSDLHPWPWTPYEVAVTAVYIPKGLDWTTPIAAGRTLLAEGWHITRSDTIKIERAIVHSIAPITQVNNPWCFHVNVIPFF